MFAMLVACATIPNIPTAAPPPAPLPDRWLLKFAPAEPKALSDEFWNSTWWHGSIPRFGGGWSEWIEFGKVRKSEAEATITRLESQGGFGAKQPGDKLTVRTVPLAVHGPLVEFDRKLYTAAIVERQSTDGKRASAMLVLGAAVEIKPNVWYQAYSDELSEGKVRVTELLAEFTVDPRTKDEGKATLRKFVRILTEPEGELTEFEGTFQRTNDKVPREVQISGTAGTGASKATVRVKLGLPDGEVPAKFGSAPILRVIATTDPAPKPLTGPPASLVEPPAKKP
jgi:hypothetical protein